MPYLEISVPLRWADIDGYQHVNNAAMLTILEEARIVAFWTSDALGQQTEHRTALLEAGPRAPTLTLIARQEVEYLLPIEYTRVPLTVRLWLSYLGSASLDVSYEVIRDGVVYVRAITTVVLVNAATGRPRRITADEREAWQQHVAPPVEFRHRR